MSKKQMPTRFASHKGKKGKKRARSQKYVPSTVDSVIEATPSTRQPEAPRPVSAPPSVLRKPEQKAWMPPRAARGQPGLSTDYAYVMKDLKRIALTAAAMFAIIGGLAFVVR